MCNRTFLGRDRTTVSMLSFPESVSEKIKISKYSKKIAFFAETKDTEWTRKRT